MYYPGERVMYHGRPHSIVGSVLIGDELLYTLRSSVTIHGVSEEDLTYCFIAQNESVTTPPQANRAGRYDRRFQQTVLNLIVAALLLATLVRP